MYLRSAGITTTYCHCHMLHTQIRLVTIPVLKMENIMTANPVVHLLQGSAAHLDDRKLISNWLSVEQPAWPTLLLTAPCYMCLPNLDSKDLHLHTATPHSSSKRAKVLQEPQPGKQHPLRDVGKPVRDVLYWGSADATESAPALSSSKEELLPVCLPRVMLPVLKLLRVLAGTAAGML